MPSFIFAWPRMTRLGARAMMGTLALSLPGGFVRGADADEIRAVAAAAFAPSERFDRLEKEIRDGVVAAGSPLGLLGRAGKNAFAPRSPTHLHLGSLEVDGGAPGPVEIYADLVAAVAGEREAASPPEGGGGYPWLLGRHPADTVERRFPPPASYERPDRTPGSFAAWLSGLPLLPAGSPVLLYNGRRKANQGAQAAVIDIDTGSRDLQQCADAVIRLRAEYLFSRGEFDRIRFRFTSGDEAAYGRWRSGFRPVIQGQGVAWRKSAAADPGWQGLRAFLDTVFQYAGSASLEKELEPVADLAQIRPGDVFIQGGFPGHAVIVVDTASSADGNRTVFLLAQSYMPAQQMHVLVNPSDRELSPWYESTLEGPLVTPEWVFERKHLRRFGDEIPQAGAAGP